MKRLLLLSLLLLFAVAESRGSKRLTLPPMVWEKPPAPTPTVKRNISSRLKYFMNIPWGSSAVTIRRIWRYSRLQNKDNNTLTGYCKLGTNDAMVDFYFVNGRFYSVAYYVILPDEPNSMNYVDQFISIRNSLIEKYGEPYDAQYLFKLGNCRGMNSYNIGDYLLRGYIGLCSNWLSDYTQLTVKCNSFTAQEGGRSVAMIIRYETVDKKLLSAAAAAAAAAAAKYSDGVKSML
ncbi:MAG: hypothetical protein PHQ27_07525 [Victivallales bacterium]|nr:hypothetical protein [Victivallales bacterium]